MIYVATDVDGHCSGDDDNYWGPALDESSDVHPAEPAIRKGQDRKGCDQRRVFTNMMTKSKDDVSGILKSMSLDEALEVQRKIGLYAPFLLGSYSKEGGGGAENPTYPPQKGRPRTKDSRGRLLGGNDVRGKAGNPQGQDIKHDGLPGKPGAQIGNPEGRVGTCRRGKRHRDSVGLGSEKKGKKSSGSVD